MKSKSNTQKCVVGKLVFMKKECLYQNLGSSDTGKCLYIALGRRGYYSSWGIKPSQFRRISLTKAGI